MLRTLKAELKAANAGTPLFCDVRFVMVYVAEAHAEDEWPISSARYNAGRGPVRVTQPTTGAERRALAQRFQRDFDPAGDVFDDVLVDDVEAGDEFERAFAPWPFRFFGVSSGCGVATAAATTAATATATATTATATTAAAATAAATAAESQAVSGGGAEGVRYGQTVSGGNLRLLEYVAHPHAASYNLEELRNWVLQLA